MEENIFLLYISKQSRASVEAEAMLRSICSEYLTGSKCQIEIIDVLAEPDKAEEAGIMAIPTLIRKSPLPACRLIGALTIKSRVLAGLGIANIVENDSDKK
jgi:circadian clock protein KaiB